MARVEGGCCLLSPDVMRLAPLRDDQRPDLPAPSPPLKKFPAAPFCYGLGKLHTPHGLLRAARVLIGRSRPYLVDLYRLCLPSAIPFTRRLMIINLCGANYVLKSIPMEAYSKAGSYQ